VDLSDRATILLPKPLVLPWDLCHPEILLQCHPHRPTPSGMQFAPFHCLAMLHAPFVGNMMTDDPFTTSTLESQRTYLNKYWNTYWNRNLVEWTNIIRVSRFVLPFKRTLYHSNEKRN
jgi:hypothetical protein